MGETLAVDLRRSSGRQCVTSIECCSDLGNERNRCGNWIFRVGDCTPDHENSGSRLDRRGWSSRTRLIVDSDSGRAYPWNNGDDIGGERAHQRQVTCGTHQPAAVGFENKTDTLFKCREISLFTCENGDP